MATERDSFEHDDPRPLWVQVQADVIHRIRRGEFTSVFPGEHQLVQEYGVSRHTVREALRSLRADGIIEGGRGRQTRVISGGIRQAQGSLYSLFASVEDAGHRQRSVVLALDSRADNVVAKRLGLEESTPLIYLERIRLCDDTPLAHDCVWLPADLAAPLLKADFSETSLYAQLEELCGLRLTGGREQVRAVVPTAAERRLLDIPDDVGTLNIERIGEARGRPVEWRRTLVRGDRFALEADLTNPSRMTVTSDPIAVTD